MGEKRTGWLSQDNTFFSTEVECRLHEAREEIRAWCDEQNVSFEKAILIIEALADPILEYVHASQELRDREQEATRLSQSTDERARELIKSSLKPSPSEVSEHQADDWPTSEDAQAVLQLADDRSQPVPNLGRSSRPKSVS